MKHVKNPRETNHNTTNPATSVANRIHYCARGFEDRNVFVAITMFHLPCVTLLHLVETTWSSTSSFSSVIVGETHLKPGIHLRQTPLRGLKNVFFSFYEVRHILSILRIRRGIPRVCLILIYGHTMARIAAASEACGSVQCIVCSSQGEAAAPPLGLPLPQVYSRLNMHRYCSPFTLPSKK